MHYVKHSEVSSLVFSIFPFPFNLASCPFKMIKAIKYISQYRLKADLEENIDQDHQERVGQVEEEPDLHRLDV